MKLYKIRGLDAIRLRRGLVLRDGERRENHHRRLRRRIGGWVRSFRFHSQLETSIGA